MIKFNPCEPCCKTLKVRVQIGACFLTDRDGNFDPPYSSIRAEFFDKGGNSLIVILDEYDVKTITLSGSYSGVITSRTTGTSSKGDNFDISQEFADLTKILIADASETDNYVCCHGTWIPKKLTGSISHNPVNASPYFINGVNSYISTDISGMVTVIKTIDSTVNIYLGDSISIEYAKNKKAWWCCFQCARVDATSKTDYYFTAGGRIPAPDNLTVTIYDPDVYLFYKSEITFSFCGNIAGGVLYNFDDRNGSDTSCDIVLNGSKVSSGIEGMVNQYTVANEKFHASIKIRDESDLGLSFIGYEDTIVNVS